MQTSTIRRLVGASLVALATLAPQAARAQSISAGLFGGATMPTGDFADAVKLGYHGGATLALSVPILPIGLRIDGEYNRFSQKADALSAALGSSQAFRAVDVTGNLTYDLLPTPVVHPYLIGGAGWYNTKLDASDVTASNDFGLNGGLGLKLGSNIFIEGRYHHVMMDGGSLNYVPVTLGVLF